MSSSTFGSSADSKQLTVTNNRQVTLSDNAVSLQNANNKRNSDNVNLRRGDYNEGSTIINNSGIGLPELSDALGMILHDAAKPETRDRGGPVDDLIDSRLQLNKDAATDSAKATNPLRQQHLIMAGLAVIVVVAIIAVIKHKPT